MKFTLRPSTSIATRFIALSATAVGAAAFIFGVTGCGHSPPPPLLNLLVDVDLAGDDLRTELDEVIEYGFHKRRLNTRQHAAWQIMHAAIPFGRNLLIDADRGRVVRAVDYALAGNPMNGFNLAPGDNLGDGRYGIRAKLEEGSNTGQGHKDQFLGYLSIASQLDPSQIVKVRGQNFTVADWVEQIKRDIHEGNERGWSLMVFAHYLPKYDTAWKANDGTLWTMERTIAVEAAGDFRKGACGGTHSLAGMTLALNRYMQETGAHIAIAGEQEGRLVDKNGNLITGGWAAASDRIQQAIDYAREFQQADGSFSSTSFENSQHSVDAEQRIRTTGHILEFLCLALSEDELHEDWVRRAALQLVDAYQRTDNVSLECGAIYHGLSALVLYRQRMFDATYGPLPYAKWAEADLREQNAKLDATAGAPAAAGAIAGKK